VKESNKTFSVILTNATNATLGSPAISTVTIFDDDKRTRTPRLTSPKRVASDW
jgi:hypothetical protein